jgi:MFS family permease
MERMAKAGVGQPDQAGYLALVNQNPNFRSLWFGEIISLFGDWFNLIASASLVASLTSSGLAVGGLFVVRMLAPFLVSPIAGVVADRYNRKKLLILAGLVRAGIVLGLLLVRDPRHLWLLYVLTAAQLAVSGFFFPARNAILPDLVAGRELGAANALASATWSVMLAVGSALGGVMAGQWGIYPAFGVDSLTFVLSAFFISRIDYQRPSHLAEAEHSLRAGLRQYLEGLRYLSQHKNVLAIALHKGALSLMASGAFQVVLVALAERVFVIGQGGGTGLGLMYAMAGLGTGLGPILARKVTGDRERPLQLFLGGSYFIVMLGLLVIAPLASFGIVLFGSFLRAFGHGINWVFSTQLLMQKVPTQVRGRVFSSEFAVFTLASALGTAAGGWMLDSIGIGISGVLWLLAGLAVIPGLSWLAWVYLHRPAGP